MILKACKGEYVQVSKENETLFPQIEEDIFIYDGLEESLCVQKEIMYHDGS